jgi:hypothetical protein
MHGVSLKSWAAQKAKYGPADPHSEPPASRSLRPPSASGLGAQPSHGSTVHFRLKKPTHERPQYQGRESSSRANHRQEIFYLLL